MNTIKKGIFGLSTVMSMGLVMMVPTLKAHTDDWVNVLRMYNPNSGEHFYIMNVSERNMLYLLGWNYEDISWAAPSTGGTIYRVYNPNNGDHHYTMSLGEKNSLVKLGWKYEGTAWKSAESNGIPIYRVYNPNSTGPGSHLYTADANEKNVLSQKLGWKYEGIAWYAAGLRSGNVSSLPSKPGSTSPRGESYDTTLGTITDGIVTID